MRILDIIAGKKAGEEHSSGELEFISRAASTGSVPDYQLSAWLMAVCLKGMTSRETVCLTRAMAGSGKTLSLAGVGLPKVDKHSTGGVGDGISIALAPLLASCGLAVPMMSGRGLGHTGGTLDKLESIPGFNVSLPIAAIEKQIRAIGVCMFGQSSDLAPADRKLYALRDATSTVDSLPLIVASILSKKVSENLDALVLDIKVGSGAIFKDSKEAARLAGMLVKTAKSFGISTVGILTGMDQPLGLGIGNSLEVRQAIEVLQGNDAARDYCEVLLALGGWALTMAGKAKSRNEGVEKIREKIRSGEGLAVFQNMVSWQGGPSDLVEKMDRYLAPAKLESVVVAGKPGYLERLDAGKVGVSGVLLGAGREKKEDSIDPGAGIVLTKKVGQRVGKGEPLARLYASDRKRLESGEAMFESAVKISPRPPKPRALVKKVVK